MEITKTFYARNRKEWRQWLKNNHKVAKDIWLVYYKKESGKPRVPYNDAVEEALCFGWIDSTVKKIDKNRFAQRFSPRNPKSSFSQSNKERLIKLLKQKKVIASVRKSLADFSSEVFKIPPDILKEINKNKEAWKNFQKFSESYKRIRIAYLDGSRNRPEEFKKRLNYFIKMTGANKQFGIKGIEKYY
jgi:uncharacterized protein YdeI (YjbR/CyaY-like superfamily)